MAERRPQVAPYYRALATLRRAHPAFTRGAVRWLRNGDEAARAELMSARAPASRSWSPSTCRRSPIAGNVVQAGRASTAKSRPDMAHRDPGVAGTSRMRARAAKLPAVVARAMGIQGFPAGNAVNTYACDCQV